MGVIGRLLEWFKVAKLDVHTEGTLAFLHEGAGPQHAMARNGLLRHLDGSHFDKGKAHQQAHVKGPSTNSFRGGAELCAQSAHMRLADSSI